MKNAIPVRYFACLLMAILLGPGKATAIVNPELQKNSTPNVLKCSAERVSSETRGETTEYSAFCRVLDVFRSSSAIKPGDLIHIRYSVNYAEIRRQVREMEEAKIPGPAPESAPRPLQDGELVIAYLEERHNADGSPIYIPSIGFESFERLASSAGRQAIARCRESGEPAIMANVKACAEEAVHESEQALTSYIAELVSRIEHQPSDPTMEVAIKSQAESLTASHAAWQQYRDETCRYAYFQYFPGSMAQLEKLTCQRELTDRRLEQLERISSLAGAPIEY